MVTYRHAAPALSQLLTRIRNAHQHGQPVPCVDTPSLDWISDETVAQRRAIAACNTCPLAPECADYATTFKEPSGIWGGTTSKSRGNTSQPRKKKVEVKNP